MVIVAGRSTQPLGVMPYIDVAWRHDDPGDPIRLVSELNDQRYETRKLEFFRDGRVEYASARVSRGTKGIGAVPVPSLDEINADPQFHGVPIESAEFEALWERYVTHDT